MPTSHTSTQTKKLTLAAAMASACLAFSLPSQAATEISEDLGSYSAPTGAGMMVDALIARPVQAAYTVGSVAVWAVSLPFSLLGGNVGDATNELVAKPVSSLFTRCLGCTEKQDQTNRILRNQYQNTQTDDVVYINDVTPYESQPVQYQYTPQNQPRVVVHPYQP